MDEFAEINITPFTDVLLVLLIIFIMMAALIVPAGFEKQFKPSGPGKHTAATLPKADLIITRSGAMSLDGRRLDERSIYPALTALHA